MNSISQFAVGGKVDQVAGGNTLVGDVQTILTAIIADLGLDCVVVMIIGGVNYMTSSGDSGKVEKAKKTILYGLIGLIVAALAFAIVQFVITGILGNTATTCGEGTHWDGNSKTCVAD